MWVKFGINWLVSSRWNFRKNLCIPLPVRGPKTAQRTLFLSFEINNCFPITVLRRRRWKNPQNLMPRGNSNIAIDIFDRSNSIIWKDFDGEARANFYRHLKYRGGCTIQLFQLGVWCEKCVAAQHYAVICKQLLISNDRNRVRWSLSEDGGLYRFVWKSQREMA